MKLALVSAALLLASTAAVQAQTVPAPVAAALADPSRPADQKVRDDARKAGPVIAFSGIKKGDKVADFLLGGGYWTRILSPLVGPTGKVYAYQSTEFIAYRADYAKEQDAAVAGLANSVAVRSPLASFSFPEPLDAIVTVQNYHDLHLRFAPPGAAKFIAGQLFAALKPGGTLLVVDHVADTDPEFKAPDALHRIDPAAARAELESVGFVFDGESAVLRNPADDRSVMVFDPRVQGKTDQFVYRFKKPK